MSSHDLESEKGRWSRTPKGVRYCEQCDENIEESLNHFLFDCKHFQHTRYSYPDYLTNKHYLAFLTGNKAILPLKSYAHKENETMNKHVQKETKFSYVYN